MERVYLVMSALLGATAVGLGAFGAHGLQSHLAGVADGAQRLAWWETAAHYHLTHALAIAIAGVVAGRAPGVAATVSGACFGGGIVLFSGSLYAMTLSGVRALGAVTPVGGLLLIVGWAALALAAWRMVG